MAVFINGAIFPSGSIDYTNEESTSLLDVITQVKSATDGEVVVYINSPGGSVDEGFAIYDYLRNLGRPIRTVAIGQCASIATVVFLAGDVRTTRCELMIHNPWSYAEGDGDQVRMAVEALDEAEKRLEKFYAERLNIDLDTISTLMGSTTYIPMEKALALGFATVADNTPEPLACASNPKSKPITKKNDKMTKTIKQKVASIFAAFIGKMLDMELTTADGTVLTIEREDGDPALGDAASPDGEFIMPDGSTIVVADGVITDIKVAEQEPTTEEQLAAANARIAELEAAALSAEQKAILEAVAIMGGIKALAKICSAYTPAPRADGHQVPQPQVAAYQKKLTELKNRRNG